MLLATFQSNGYFDELEETILIGSNRRTFLGFALGSIMAERLTAIDHTMKFDEATRILEQASADGLVRASVLHARIGNASVTRAFGQVPSVDSAFLLGSISKPIAITALMTLYDQGKFDLNDPVTKYIPEFRGDARERVIIRHLLTHVSGLPDQLPENSTLRSKHAPLSDFVAGATRVPLKFEPGSRYEYSSMAILLASEIAQRLSGIEFKELVDRSVLQPLGMTHSAMGLGRLRVEDTVSCQVEFGAVEAGGGSPDSKNWNWNSSYWRELGAPWGGAHASAKDVGLLLEELMHPTGKLFRSDVARLMLLNHNRQGLPARGLGFDVGMDATCPGCSKQAFGHTGSTGTIAWADPERDAVCVVLTSLPGQAVSDHPRQLASNCISAITE